MSTREMRVANIAFLLDRLAADTPANQQIRELTQNALEAVQRRHRAGDTAEGVIRWDIDWDHFRRVHQYKLSVVDNGDGMTAEQMEEYLNSLAVEGANQTQSISKNFGVGAKITALFRNRFGLVYQSWRDSKGTMVKLHRDDKHGVYGLDAFNLEDGPVFTPRIKDAVKPRTIEATGTKVTLLGSGEDDNTCFPADDAGTGMNWLIRYLTNRYFRIPDNVRLQVRVLTKDEADWPAEEPPGSEKTYNLQTVRGAKALFDQYADEKGTVRLATADAHWWLYNEPAAASKNMSTRGGRTSQMGLVFQDEVYIQRTPPASRRLLAGFGVVFGADHVVIYIEPRNLDIRADTARSRILINGEDVEEANWWETWGAEFKTKMPVEIERKVAEIMAKTERDPEGKTRERILERLRRIKELLRPSRYKRDPNGTLLATGRVSGGASGTINRSNSGGGSGSGGGGGRSSDEYLADLVEAGGEPVSPVEVSVREPEVRWISRVDGTRAEEELDDRAAEVVGDILTGDTIKANADFRGYLDIVAFFAKEFNPNGDPAIQRKITEYVQEWFASQLVEAVMTVRNLANGRTWGRHEFEQALSPLALTSVVMTRFHIVERVKRSLGSELTRPQTRVA